MPEYKDMYESATVGLWRTNLETGEWLSANEATLKILGYSDFNELAKCRSTDLYCDKSARQELVEHLKEVKEFNEFEVIMRRKDGKEIVVILSAKINLEKGYIEGSVRDVTNIISKESMSLIPYLEKMSNLKKNIMEKIEETDCVEFLRLRRVAKTA